MKKQSFFACLLLLFVISCGSTTKNWTTIITFTGNGPQKTHQVRLLTPWRLLSQCEGLTMKHATANATFTVNITNINGSTRVFDAVNTLCKAGQTTQTISKTFDPATLSFTIKAGASWVLQVQQ